MRSDTEIKMQAFQVLFQSLGSLETERFISIIKRNNFDYTKWRENLPKFTSVQELSKAAMESRKKRESQ
ncbi:MAG: hypothetical protein IPL26_15930 [Leptospiraceae bacterium]|nr:hypothetical protein [Leptospiraceae bacterium]